MDPEVLARVARDGVRTLEELTHDDLRRYTRNQLRAYCRIYGIKREVKPQLEWQMATLLEAFHPHDPTRRAAAYLPSSPGAATAAEAAASPSW
eukprot:contig_38987_g9064